MNQMVDKPEPSLGHITALGQISVSAIRLVLIIGSGRQAAELPTKPVLRRYYTSGMQHNFMETILKYKSDKFIHCSW